MEPTIWVCILTVVGNIVVSVLTNSKTQSLLEYKIEELTKKVTAHNNLVERTYKIESDLKTAFVKIDNLYEEVEDVKHEKCSN